MLNKQFLVAFVSFFLFICTSLLLLLCLILFVECVAACFSAVPYQRRYDDQDIQDIQDKQVTVLVPAHNEEAVIRRTLLNLKKELKNQRDLIVVADN